MSRDSLPTKIASLVAIVVLFSAVTGCTKQRASMSLKKLDKQIALAQKYQAQKYEAAQLQEAQGLKEEAQRNFETQQYPIALERAKKGVDTIKKVIDSARAKYAADRKQDAEEAIRLADINKGSEKDPQRYQKIQQLDTKARERMAKNKWDDVITLSDEIIIEVDNLLRPLKTDAERRQTTAINRFHEMEAQGAREFAPSYVVTVQDLLNTVDLLIKERHDYLEAQNKAEETIQKTEEGILKTKEAKSHKLLSFIEGELTTAYVKDAEIWAPELYKRAQEQFDQMLRHFYEKDYDFVLMTEEDITSRVAKLIYVTRKSSANNKIETVQKAINSLVEGGVREYLPGRIDVMERKLEEARAKFAKEDFDAAESDSLIALDEGDKIEADFNSLALDAMRSAGGTLDVTQSVFDKMQSIFMIKPTDVMTPLERDFENSKETFRVELGTMLQNARLSLGVAQLRQEDRQYRKAIEISADIKKTAEYVLNEVYHVVAHNAIIELASHISRYEKDGALEYAPEELARTKTLLEEAKALVQQTKFKEAVAKASETRAQLEVTVQTLQQKAIASIDELKQSLDKAGETKVGDYKPDDLLRSETLLKESQAALSAQKLKPAIESAFNAAKILSAASEQASRQWAEDEIENAHNKIALAESAGATSFAPEILDEASKLLAQSRTLYADKQYVESKDAALRAAETARNALYKPLNLAQSAIAEAKNYGAWKYYSSALADVIIAAQTAQEAVGRKDFSTYQSYAEKARKDAEALAVEARTRTFHGRVSTLETALHNAMDSGVNYFQSEEAKTLFKDMAEVDGNYNDKDYDLYRKKLDQIDARLEKMVADNPSVVEKIITQETARLRQLVEEKRARDFAAPEVEQARKLLNYAEFDYKDKKFQTAYRDVRRAIDAIDQINLRLQDEQYRKQVNELFSELSQAMRKFDRVLSLDPSVLVESARGYNGKGQALAIGNPGSPVEFRTSLDELILKAAAIKPPSAQQKLNKHVLDTLNTVRLSATYFEKFIILDQMDERERKETIEKAYDLMAMAKKMLNDIQAEFVKREAELRS
jgi:hypothetical protein